MPPEYSWCNFIIDRVIMVVLFHFVRSERPNDSGFTWDKKHTRIYTYIAPMSTALNLKKQANQLHCCRTPRTTSTVYNQPLVFSGGTCKSECNMVKLIHPMRPDQDKRRKRATPSWMAKPAKPSCHTEMWAHFLGSGQHVAAPRCHVKHHQSE